MKKEVGRLRFSLEDFFADGQFGPVYRGKLDETTQVHIEKIDKSKFLVHEKVLIQDHDNILKYYTVEKDLEFYYVGSEPWAASLEDLVTGNLQVGEITDWRSTIRQITEAVAYLHQKEIIHRDLKPSNILISSTGGKSSSRIKLANFGISRIIGNPFALWKIAGSRNWMPSEMYDMINFAFSMDLFSLGGIYAYILSGGLHPFGLNEEEQILRIKRKERMVLTPKQFHLAEQEADQVFALVQSMLNPNPKQRPSVTAVLQAPYLNQSKEDDIIVIAILKAEKRIEVIQLDDSSDEEVTFISPATENVKAVNTRFAVIKEEKLEADVSQNCSGKEAVVSTIIKREKEMPMSPNQSTLSLDAELHIDTSLLPIAVEDIPLPPETGETLIVKDEKINLTSNMDHLRDSFPRMTPPMTPLPPPPPLPPLLAKLLATEIPSNQESCQSNISFLPSQTLAPSLEFPSVYDYGLNCLSPSVLRPVIPSSNFFPNFFPFTTHGHYLASERFTPGNCVPFSSTIQPAQPINFAAGASANSFVNSTTSVSDPTHMELTQQPIKIECDKRLIGLSAESNQCAAVVLSGRDSQENIELQPEREASTVIHVRPEPTANSDVSSTSASSSRDLVDLTPKIANKELEKVPAKKASNTFQEKRKCSDAEDARTVKITKLTSPVVVPMATKQQIARKSGSRMGQIPIASKNLLAKNAVEVTSGKSIQSSNQPGTSREALIPKPTQSGVKTGNKLQIGCGPNGVLQINESNPRMQTICQKLNVRQPIIINPSSRKSTLLPLSQKSSFKANSAPGNAITESVMAQVLSGKTTPVLLNTFDSRKESSEINQENCFASRLSSVLSSNRPKVADITASSTGSDAVMNLLPPKDTNVDHTYSTILSFDQLENQIDLMLKDQESSVSGAKVSVTSTTLEEGERVVNEPSDGEEKDGWITNASSLSAGKVNRGAIRSFEKEEDVAINLETGSTARSISLDDFYTLPEKSVEVLRKWFYNHETNPYPNKDEMRALVKESKLALSQVDTWFYTERQRQRKRNDALGSEGNLERAKTKFYRLPSKSVEVLQNWFDSHLSNPYPNKSQKGTLAKQSRLTYQQINNWFIMRRRYREPKGETRLSDNQIRSREKHQNTAHLLKKQLSLTSLAVLNKWFSEHYDNPYPTLDQKTALAEEAGIDILQVQNWFINARRGAQQFRSSTSMNPSYMTSNSETGLQISTQDLSDQNKEELEVVPLPESIKDHDYCIVLPKPVISPLRVCSDYLVEMSAENISEQEKMENDREPESDGQDFTSPSEDSSSSGHLSPLALLFRTNQEGNLLTQVKSVLDQNGLNSSDNPDLNAAVCESDALIGLCNYQHDHPDFIAIARLLIENGANINAVDDRFRNSLLILCVEHLDADDLLDMTQFLIQNGIDFKARDKDGNSAAKILCIRGFSKESAIMRLLLRS